MNYLILELTKIQKKCFKLLLFCLYIMFIILITSFSKYNIFFIILIFTIIYIILYNYYFKNIINKQIIIEDNEIFKVEGNNRKKIGNFKDITGFGVSNEVIYVYNKEKEIFYFLNTDDCNSKKLVNYLNKNTNKLLINGNNLYLQVILFIILILPISIILLFSIVYIKNMIIILCLFFFFLFLLDEIIANYKIIDNKIYFYKLFRRDKYNVENIKKVIISSTCKYGTKDYRVKFYINKRFSFNFHLFNENIDILKEICKKNSIKFIRK